MIKYMLHLIILKHLSILHFVVYIFSVEHLGFDA